MPSHLLGAAHTPKTGGRWSNANATRPPDSDARSLARPSDQSSRGMQRWSTTNQLVGQVPSMRPQWETLDAISKCLWACATNARLHAPASTPTTRHTSPRPTTHAHPCEAPTSPKSIAQTARTMQSQPETTRQKRNAPPDMKPMGRCACAQRISGFKPFCGTPTNRWCPQSRNCFSRPRQSSCRAPCWRSNQDHIPGLD